MDLVEIVVASFAIGALRAINTWDLPTYLAVIASALVIGEYARRQTIGLSVILGAGWRLAAIVVLSSLLYQPFISHLATAYTSVEPWLDRRTQMVDYLTVHGIFFFVLATFLIVQTLASKPIAACGDFFASPSSIPLGLIVR